MPKPPEATEEDLLRAELMGEGASEVEETEERLHPLLSNEEVLEARQKARDQVEAKKRLAAKKALIEAETLRLEREEGLVTGNDAKDEIVQIHLDLAEYTDRIVINGQVYAHGNTYTVPRHVADTLRDIATRTHEHQNQVEGKDIANRLRRPQSPVIGIREMH